MAVFVHAFIFSILPLCNMFTDIVKRHIILPLGFAFFLEVVTPETLERWSLIPVYKSL